MRKEMGRLKQKWSPVFGDEIDNLIDDLKHKRLTDNVQVYLFDNLAEVQPISLSTMPQKYLDHPNGRLFYMLRSFTIKQLDLMRRDILTKLAEGRFKEGFGNFASLATLFVLANGTADMAKDFMTGKEIEMEDTMVDNVWKMVGLNRYTGDKVLAGTPGQAVIDMIAPPLTVWDRAIRSVGDPQKMWEVSPFNGLQIFDELLQTGWTRSKSENNSAAWDSFHSTWDE
jgi:hypothetical protein